MSFPSLIKVCGSCDYPDFMHTNDNNVVVQYADGFKVECPRSYDQIGTAYWYDDKGREYADYFLIRDSDGNYQTVLSQDYSGAEAQSGSDLIKNRIADDYGLTGIGADEAPYVSPLDPHSEQAKVDRWRDNAYRATASTQTWICTSLLGEEDGEYDLTVTTDAKTGKKSYSKTPSGQEVSREDRNAFLEGYDGFLSIHLLDEVLTKKYHARLLNVYRDKQNFLRIGSVRIVPLDDGRIGARCVNDTCSGRLIIDPALATREDQEDFIYSCIAHGNNHAAKWFRERKEGNVALFYELAPTLTSQPLLTDEESLSFLMEHSNYCKDSKCTCSDLIRQEVAKTLAKNTHLKVSA